ncbi:hypothetical protein LTR84_008363 [Exophiala bonariae]|uniref:NmrA-like domain-containing protein n=1 Tax=Exophiala bonariae TaxID=1690606 RepID=A0AAV9MXD7_9EURO|nr:hypothetical protein LTR84_008363 [Exophiala bonariae]
MTSKLIVVVGATGTQGGSVVRTFSKIPGWEVRAITRKPDSEAARRLKNSTPNITIYKADLDDVESLKAAFEGADAIFGVTDFWQFVPQYRGNTQEVWDQAKAQYSHGVPLDTSNAKATWNEVCYLREFQQGKNIIDAAAHAVPGLETLVLSSLSDAQKASNGKYTWVYHFDSKAHYVKYLKSKAESGESSYQLLLKKTSYLQMGYYLDNWKMNPFFTPKKGEDGTVLFRSFDPIDTGKAEHPTPFVHPPTDTGPFVEALVLKAAPGTVLLGTSGPMPFNDYIKLWGQIQGFETNVQYVSSDQVVELWPDGFGLELAQTASYVRDYGWDGGERAILPEQAGVDLSALTDVTSYIKSTDWSSVLNN